MKIKEYAYEDRPYEKLLNKGAKSLTDTELLAIIINTGTKAKNVMDVARSVLTNENTNIGLSFLTQYSIEELMKVEGIGKTKAIQLMAVCEIAHRINIGKPSPKDRINTPEQLSRVFKLDLHEQKQEIVETAILDSKNRIKKVITNSIGNVNSNNVDIKDILSEPISMGASKIAVAHNHPSGDITPSHEDIVFTQKLNEACKLMNIQLLDHIIIRWR